MKSSCCRIFLFVTLAACGIQAFAPTPTVSRPTFLLHQDTLSVVDPNDPFDNYRIDSSQTTVAYKDVEVGNGESIQTDDVVTFAYTGRLLSNGKQFDQGNGFTFKLGGGRVMPGLDQGIRGMKVGGKRVLKIPPNLAYGEKGAGEGKIPPNAHLEFECELLSIATNPLEAAYSQLNWQPERTITFVLMIVLFAAAPSLPDIPIPSF